jgi:hypothetical protein
MLQSTFADQCQWLMNSCFDLQEKYKDQVEQISRHLKVEVTGDTVVIDINHPQKEVLLANELLLRGEFLTKNGIGLKVLVGGEVFADFPSSSITITRSSMVPTINDVWQGIESKWLEREWRGVFPNRQRIQSLQQNDGTVYLISAREGGNNVIKAVFPFLGLEDVLATKSVGSLMNKPVSYSFGKREPESDDPALVGGIRARVAEKGAAEGYYQENYEFVFHGVVHELQAEYMSLDNSDDEAIIVVRNLDSIQRGGWVQRRKRLLG